MNTPPRLWLDIIPFRIRNRHIARHPGPGKTRDTVAEFSVSGHLTRSLAAKRRERTVRGRRGHSAHGCRVLAPAERVRQNRGRLLRSLLPLRTRTR